MMKNLINLAAKMTFLVLLSIFSASCGQGAPPVSDGFAEINGTELYYKRIGTGEPIIFLHGSGGSHRYFLPHVEPLSDSFELVFYDQRGTGLSDGELEITAVTIDQFAEDLDGLRTALGYDQVTLLGHSWGAIYALAYTIQHPASVDRLILVDSIPVRSNHLFELAESLQKRIRSLDSESQEIFFSTCSASLDSLSAEEITICNAINAEIRFYDPDTALRADTTVDENTAKNSDSVQNLIRSNFNQVRPAIESDLASINVPTLVLHGDFDPIPAASAEFIQGQIPAAQMILMEMTGHFPFIEQPEMFMAHINAFLHD